jgi:hypothetical protein
MGVRQIARLTFAAYTIRTPWDLLGLLGIAEVMGVRQIARLTFAA